MARARHGAHCWPLGATHHVFLDGKLTGALRVPEGGDVRAELLDFGAMITAYCFRWYRLSDRVTGRPITLKELLSFHMEFLRAEPIARADNCPACRKKIECDKAMASLVRKGLVRLERTIDGEEWVKLTEAGHKTAQAIEE